MRIKKSFLFLLILLFGTFTVKTQNNTYHPLVQEGKVWSIVDVDDSMGIENLKFSTTQMAFFGDTIISDTPYKKMYATTKEFPVFPQDWTLQNFMREDEDKKVWYKKINSGTEKLCYDFSLEIGDTIPKEIGEQFDLTESVIVEDISNMLMQNGKEYKIFHLSILCGGFPSHKEYWIEGIGSSLGVVFPITGMLQSGYTRLLCFRENNELIYNQFWEGTCYKSGWLGILNDLDSRINIYPNPVKNVLHIKLNEIIIINGISIMNLQGQTIRQYESCTTQIDVSNIMDGVYFIKLSSSKGDIIRKVIISK